MNNFYNNSSIPVLFWIHGGSLLYGSCESDIFGHDFILEKDIIVVTINYRLGPLGFPLMPNVTVNLGIKDQIEAMKWVQRNIKNFGGDPNRVTLVGCREHSV